MYKKVTAQAGLMLKGGTQRSSKRKMIRRATIREMIQTLYNQLETIERPNKLKT
jgi:hypothetical protein